MCGSSQVSARASRQEAAGLEPVFGNGRVSNCICVARRGDATALAATEKGVVRPIAIFAIIVVVGLIAIEAGLRATGNSASANPLPKTPTPLTHAEFIRAGNRVCDRYYREGSRYRWLWITWL